MIARKFRHAFPRAARLILAAELALATLLLFSSAALASSTSVAVRDSFRIGNAGVVCTAQYAGTDRRLQDIYDRGYKLVCRDAAAPVGSMLALRDPVVQDRALHAVSDVAGLQCAAPVRDEIDGLGTAEMTACLDPQARLDYRRYRFSRAGISYYAEGLAGYDKALRLGLATMVADRPIAGAVDVVSTLVSDPASFARVQAGALDDASARREAYGRNNGGSYAQAAEFFESLANRDRADQSQTAEFLSNNGLQQSNLGNFAVAAAQFARADQKLGARDFVAQRMLRNFRAIDALNRGDPDAALAALAVAVAPVVEAVSADGLNQGVINPSLSQAINREDRAMRRITGGDASLTPVDRAAVLDGQAIQLRGLAARQQGKLDEASALLLQSMDAIAAVRGGRIISLGWMQAESLAELAAIAEVDGNKAQAEAWLRQGLGIYVKDFPETPAMLAAMARLASFTLRNGDAGEGLRLYGDLTSIAERVPDSSAAIRDLLTPYFAKLGANGADPAANEAYFRTAQLLQRPGVAQTQAILAREFSQGNDEASALFRLSLTRSREIARLSAEISAMQSRSDLLAQEVTMLAEQRESLALLEREQTELVAQLSQFPAYRAIAPQSIRLADLQAMLREGEAYYRLTIVGGKAFAQSFTRASVRNFTLAQDEAGLAAAVASLRDSIVRQEDGQMVTYPFDVDTARALHRTLFDPVAQELAGITHLIFEPDGAMMQLPPYLLVASDTGLAAYHEQAEQPDGDEFDFTGIDWLGRHQQVSIAVSPRSFGDVRAIAPSAARMAYLGMGQNARPAARSATPAAAAAAECSWPLLTWQAPIRDAELRLASSIVGAASSRLLTGAEFTDEALSQATDLADYRILHFATHGLVTAPRPSCPPRPALVTSFGGPGSDGLLSFKEVFDLRLDADVVILSACDTAGMATVSASREAGVTTGGNFALDGLVRAFVGAGARSVLASHWPVPDDYQATNKLIGGLFRAPAGTGLAAALSTTQRSLMDDPATSRPYYWAAFVVLGDGTKPLISSQ